MKDDFKHIEELYKETVAKQLYVPSVSFKMRLSLLLMSYQFRKYLLWFIIIIGLSLGGYCGFTYLYNDGNNNDVSQVAQNYEDLEIIDSSVYIDIVESQVVDDVVILVSEQSTNNLNNNVSSVDLDFYKSIITEEKVVATTFDNKLLHQSHIKYIETGIVDKDNYSDVSIIIPEPILIDSMYFDNFSNDIVIATSEIKEEKASMFSVSIYGSPAITSSILRADDRYSNYVNLRQNNESPVVSWAVGGDLQVHFKQWFVQVGLDYSVCRNNRNYNYNYQSLDSVNSYFSYDTVWVWVYDPPNLEYPVMVGIDTTWIPVYEDVNVVSKGVNEWSYLEIPILIGYNFKINKIGFEVASGISFGFLMNYSVSYPKIPDGEGMETFINHDQNINSTMLNYLLKVGVSYPISNKLELIAQPYYKQNLQSLFKEDFPIDQKQSAFGLNIGFRINF